MMEVRHVQIGYTTVQVEVDPNDFKKNMIAAPVFVAVGCFVAVSGGLSGLGVLLGLLLIACAPLAWLAHRAAWKGRVDMAVREAAYQGVYRYER